MRLKRIVPAIRAWYGRRKASRRPYITRDPAVSEGGAVGGSCSEITASVTAEMYPRGLGILPDP
jgi:hypothetical protein